MSTRIPLDDPRRQADEFTIDIQGCARCDGEGHLGLTFHRLRHPVELQGCALTHWATCPTTGEPIMLLVH